MDIVSTTHCFLRYLLMQVVRITLHETAVNWSDRKSVWWGFGYGVEHFGSRGERYVASFPKIRDTVRSILVVRSWVLVSAVVEVTGTSQSLVQNASFDALWMVDTKVGSTEWEARSCVEIPRSNKIARLRPCFKLWILKEHDCKSHDLCTVHKSIHEMNPDPRIS